MCFNCNSCNCGCGLLSIFRSNNCGCTRYDEYYAAQYGLNDCSRCSGCGNPCGCRCGGYQYLNRYDRTRADN